MDPLTMAAIGAGLGLVKSEIVDRPRADRERKREAEIARWSPWTGMQANRVGEADPLGNSMQFGMTGAMLGQGMQNTDKMNTLMDKQAALLDAQAAGSVAVNGASYNNPMTPMAMSPQGYGMSPMQGQGTSPWLFMNGGTP